MRNKGIIFTNVFWLVISIVLCGRVYRDTANRSRKHVAKIMGYYWVWNEWVRIHNRGVSLCDYFKKHNYNKVAIYGGKELGVRLKEELENSDIAIECIIDKNQISGIGDDVCLIKPEDTIPQVDVIVITASFYFDDIYDALKNKVDCDIISIEDVVFNSK